MNTRITPDPDILRGYRNSNGNGHNPIDVESFEICSDVEAALNKLKINELRKLAKKHGVDTKGTKFFVIHRLIEAGFSEADLAVN